MDKIKSVWRNNKIIFVLFIILIICLIAIISVAMSYFVGSEKSPYGNRLENKVKLPDNFEKDIKKYFEDDSNVKNATVRLSIRTLYINILFQNDITLEKAEEFSKKVLEKIDKEILDYYDVNFILTKEKSEVDEGFNIMGARNSSGSDLLWNNNNVETKAEEKEE